MRSCQALTACRVQVLAELIISNESRILKSDSVSFYNRMRSFAFTAVIRYQVSTPSLAAEVDLAEHLPYQQVICPRDRRWLLANATTNILMRTAVLRFPEISVEPHCATPQH